MSEFVVEDYIDDNLKDEVCLLCSLPLNQRKDLELLVYRGEDRKTLASKYNLRLSDINHHFENCIVDRDSSIPKGKLMGQLLQQVSSFLTELETYRVYVNGERNPDSLKTYALMFRELRQSVESLNKFDSPEYQANKIKGMILKPLIFTLVKGKIDKLGELKDQVLSLVPEDQKNFVEFSFTEAAKSWGQLASTQQKQSELKLAELFGINSNQLN
jgi:hypothetical protein